MLSFGVGVDTTLSCGAGVDTELSRGAGVDTVLSCGGFDSTLSCRAGVDAELSCAPGDDVGLLAVVSDERVEYARSDDVPAVGVWHATVTQTTRATPQATARSRFLIVVHHTV